MSLLAVTLIGQDRPGIIADATSALAELGGNLEDSTMTSLRGHFTMVLLDEPFSALDAFTRADLQDHLLDLWADTRPTLLLVTHDVDEAVMLADRVLVMRPRPGRLFEAIRINLTRPRDRASPLFENFKRHVLTALDRSLYRNVPDADPKTMAGEAMWW